MNFGETQKLDFSLPPPCFTRPIQKALFSGGKVLQQERL
jgi:hypothetical protein